MRRVPPRANRRDLAGGEDEREGISGGSEGEKDEDTLWEKLLRSGFQEKLVVYVVWQF